MAIADRKIHVIYDPAFSRTPLLVEVDGVAADPPLSSRHLADVAAGLLVPLSIVLLALRVSGTMPHVIQAAGAYAVFVFFFAYPLYRLVWSIAAGLHRARASAEPATWSEPRWVAFNWAWTLVLLWLLSMPSPIVG